MLFFVAGIAFAEIYMLLFVAGVVFDEVYGYFLWCVVFNEIYVLFFVAGGECGGIRKDNRSEYNLHLATAKSSLGGGFSFAFTGSQRFRIILGYSRIGLALEMILQLFCKFF